MAEEKIFENRIKRFLNDNGAWFVKFFANRNTREGVPDILACVGGRFVAIEVKSSKGRPSELQIYHCKKISEAGGIGIIVYPDDFDVLREMLLKVKGGEEDVSDFIFEGVYLHPMST